MTAVRRHLNRLHYLRRAIAATRGTLRLYGDVAKPPRVDWVESNGRSSLSNDLASVILDLKTSVHRSLDRVDGVRRGNG